MIFVLMYIYASKGLETLLPAFRLVRSRGSQLYSYFLAARWRSGIRPTTTGTTRCAGCD